MAPMPEDAVETHLKEVLQDLYEIQSATHGYLGPETQQVLVNKIHDLTTSLSALSTSSNSLTTTVPPEIIAYIEEGRNPDIYTREFVELVQRVNVFLKGKAEAFRGFADVLEEEMETAGIGDGSAEGKSHKEVDGGNGITVKREEQKESEQEKVA